MRLPLAPRVRTIVVSRVLCCVLLPLAAAAQQPVLLDQGPDWTPATRSDYHSRSQGSRIMPLRWMSALKQAKATLIKSGPPPALLASSST